MDVTGCLWYSKCATTESPPCSQKKSIANTWISLIKNLKNKHNLQSIKEIFSHLKVEKNIRIEFLSRSLQKGCIGIIIMNHTEHEQKRGHVEDIKDRHPNKAI